MPSVTQPGTVKAGNIGHDAEARPNNLLATDPIHPVWSRWKMWVNSCVMTSSIQSSKWERSNPSMGGRAYTVMRLEGNELANPFEKSAWSVSNTSSMPFGGSMSVALKFA